MTMNRKEQSEKGFLYGSQIRLVHVVFGMPSLNCRRYGLCRIEDRSDLTLENTEIKRQPNTALAYMSLSPSCIIFQFLKETMTEKDINKFFGTATFLITEDKPISKRLATLLGIESATILRGCYPIKKRDENFELTAKALFVVDEKILTASQTNGTKAA